MCGVMGYIGTKHCVGLIYDGLKRLEYRGYDSAGIAVLSGGEIGLVKSEGKLSQLEPLLPKLPSQAVVGMGHTRWATHGAPTTVNAHPHTHEDISIIHNGIIENYRELKEELMASGVVFRSETDTEVVLHLLHAERKHAKDMIGTIQRVVQRLRGAYALGIMSAREPTALYMVKMGSPMVIGIGEGENYFASDALALLPLTKTALFLNDGEFAQIAKDQVKVWDFTGKALQRPPTVLNWTAASAEKQGYRHFMLKEIHEQPAVLANTLNRLVDSKTQTINLKELELDKIDLDRVRHVTFVACGTAHYSAMLGRYFMETMAGLPVGVELASEFRYRLPFVDKHSMVIAVSQSGETADTLACIKYAKEKGAQVYSVCNVRFSSIPRSCDGTLYMEAGPEVGVASTKAFTSMILCQFILAMAVGQRRGQLKPKDSEPKFNALRQLPTLADRAVNSAGLVEELATRYYEAKNMLYIGRGPSFPVAFEGALKLKEISYIHAEGYAGGELKHGPIALVDRHMPIVSIAPRDEHYEKMISNVEEVRAREGVIIGVGAMEDDRFRSLCKDYMPCPQIADSGLQSILSTIPLQLFAYYVAVKRGTDVDQPRNLAKSVTVE
jgi:glucosamine--fructose-6-phosphate aminotransferase (isomerizing)